MMIGLFPKLRGIQSMHPLQHVALLSSYSRFVSHASLTLI